MATPISYPVPGPDLESNRQGISRSLALGRILHWEALMRRRLGEVRPQRYVRLHNYYAGQNLPPDNVDQPLNINYVKQIIDKHTSYLWGEWREHLFKWRVSPIHKEFLQQQEQELRDRQQAEQQQLQISHAGEQADLSQELNDRGEFPVIQQIPPTMEQQQQAGQPRSAPPNGGKATATTTMQSKATGQGPSAKKTTETKKVEEKPADQQGDPNQPNAPQPMAVLHPSVQRQQAGHAQEQFTLEQAHQQEPSPMKDAEDFARKLKFFMDQLYEDNKLNITLWQASHNACLYGDGVLKVYYDELTRKIRVTSILPEYYHCMWKIDDMQTLTEVIIAYPIDRVEALETYGTAGNDQFLGYQAINPHYLPGIGIYWERWSTTSFQIWIDDVNVVNAPNPYMQVDQDGNIYPGIIPFIHVQNMQAGAEFWGYGDAESVLYLQDEFNRRMADMGDIVNMHAHPIVTLKAFTGDVTDLPVGPDAIWDMGREGEADRLDGKGPDQQTMEYLQKVLDTMFDTASMPPSAFGTHKGGTSHQSGLALSMALLPVVERAKEKRIKWTEGLKRLAKTALFILAVRDPAQLEAFGIDYVQSLQYLVEPVFADILPKDRLELVNEYVARSGNLLASIPSALEALGEDDVASEYDRIKQDAQFKAQLGANLPQLPGATGSSGKNSETGQGGSPGIPGSIGAKLGQPGIQISGQGLGLKGAAPSDSLSLSNQPGS